MSNVSQWSTTAASNNSASPNGWPEGMSPSGVNDSARENMAALAKVYTDQKGTLVTTGTGTAYVLSTNNSHAALGDIGLTVFRIHTANTGSATLAVDGLTAKTMKIAGANLVSGDLPQDSLVVAAYNSTGDVFDVFVFPAGGVTKTGTQTLTNKTLTSPDIDTPDIDGGTIDNTVIGGTTPAAATVTTLTANSSVSTDTINEKTSASGVTVDGVLLKDSAVSFDSGSNYLGVYQAYTPTPEFGGASTGITGTFSGRYAMVGKDTCHVIVDCTFTNKGSATGALTVPLPITAASSGLNTNFQPAAMALLAGAINGPTCRIASGAADVDFFEDAVGSTSGGTTVANTDVGNTTIIRLNFIYETA